MRRKRYTLIGRVHGLTQQSRFCPCVVTLGFVSEATKPRCVETLHEAVRLRGSWVVGAVMAVLAVLLAWRFTGIGGALHEDALSWAVSRETGRLWLGFGG